MELMPSATLLVLLEIILFLILPSPLNVIYLNMSGLSSFFPIPVIVLV